MNIGEWPTKRAMLQPDSPIIISDDGRAFTYGDFNRRVNRLANALPKIGVTRQERIAALFPNNPEFLELLFATAKIGAIMIPLNYRLAAAELTYILDDCGATALAYTPEFAEQVKAIRGNVEGIKKYISVGGAGEEGDLEYEKWISKFPDSEPAVDPGIGMDDPHFIMYTAGTTGKPKGAVLTHGNTHWNAINLVLAYMLCGNEVNLMAAPLYHIGGLSAAATPTIYSGGSVILSRFFNPTEALKMIESHNVTTMFGIPSMFHMMAGEDKFDNTDFSSVRFFITGGAPCPVPLIERYLSKGVAFSQGYGLAETAPAVTALPYKDSLRKRGSAGKPMFYVTTEIFDENEMEVPQGEVGEVVVKGPNVFKGYWNLQEETEEALKHGWFHTGDLGYFDSEGYLYITGRKKDMIISGGENIYPAEVENVIREHPAVADVGIIGMPDVRWGEVPLGVVVTGPGKDVTEQELTAFCGEMLARYKTPKKFIFADELPRDDSGHILKKELRAMYIQE
jgi:fatty-acyl-CoA synthase